MKTAKELLEEMIGQTTYMTTRGTTGDADGLLTIDQDIIDEFEYAEVINLSDLSDINVLASDDIVDYINKYIQTVKDFFVIYYDTQFILAWD